MIPADVLIVFFLGVLGLPVLWGADIIVSHIAKGNLTPKLRLLRQIGEGLGYLLVGLAILRLLATIGSAFIESAL